MLLMLSKLKFIGSAAIICAALHGCGGGSTDSAEPIKPESFNLTTVISSGSGTIQPSNVTAAAGSNVEFNLKPDDGFTLLSVVGCSGILSETTYRITNMTNNCTISVNFSKTTNTFKITTIVNEGGSIVPSQQIVNEGSNASFSVATNDGYTLNTIQGCNGLLIANQYQITNLRSDCVISATFTDSRRPASQLKYNLNSGNVNLSWQGNALLGYKVYVAEQPFEDTKTSEFEFDIYPTKDNFFVIPLQKSYNHIYVRVAALYEGKEILSSEMLEIQSNYQPTGRLNDTGLAYCLSDTLKVQQCITTSANRQDGNSGRDADAARGLLAKSGLGSAGFDFTKIDRFGRLLPIQNAIWKKDGSEIDGSNWSCVRDNLTGLIWEVKTDTGERSKYNEFTWYQEPLNLNGGVIGTAKNETCKQKNCNTKEYVAYVNNLKLCGSNKWRLPTRAELVNIVYNAGVPTRIDPLIFPDVVSDTTYWSTNTYAIDANNAWAVSVNNGIALWLPKSKLISLRLVHAE